MATNYDLLKSSSPGEGIAPQMISSNPNEGVAPISPSSNMISSSPISSLPTGLGSPGGGSYNAYAGGGASGVVPGCGSIASLNNSSPATNPNGGGMGAGSYVNGVLPPSNNTTNSSPNNYSQMITSSPNMTLPTNTLGSSMITNNATPNLASPISGTTNVAAPTGSTPSTMNTQPSNIMNPAMQGSMNQPSLNSLGSRNKLSTFGALQ